MFGGLESHLDELRAAAQGEPLGLYLHIPFCKDRCRYCSFVSSANFSRKSVFLARMKTNICVWGEILGRPKLDTLYLGGGTPSVLDLTEIAGLTQAIDSSFDASNRIESTIEANPGTVDMAWLRGARNLGFNRISLGIQTLDDELLRRLGRIHSSQEALEVLRVAQEAGFERISADLMLGISGQRTSRVMEDARVLADKGVEHLSIYMLDLDKDCPLKRDLEAGRMTLPAEDEVADAFETLQQNLPGLGLHAYEISNFARPGCEAKHNLRYWERRPYLGLGPSAASHLSRWRWSECEDIEAWSLGQVPLQMQELSSAEELAEIPLLGLRMRQGVDWDEVRKRASLSGLGPLVDSWKKALDQFCKQGLLKQDGNRYSLTSKGMLLSNEVMELFV